jgi:hypothetical protein
VICGNRCLTILEVADDMSISKGSCHQIFTEKREMRCVSAKFVLHFLTVEISEELLANANGNENFIKNIITGDEKRLYEYDVEANL